MIYICKLISPLATGISAGDIEVGKEVVLNENSSPVNYIVVHQGLPGDMYDSSCEGTWVLRKDIAENRVWDSGNVNDYANSDINAYLNGDWLTRYDSDVAGQIVQCKIPYVNGSGDSPVASGASGLSVKAFLLGGYEVGWTTSNSPYFPVDGAKLAYFTSGTSTSADKNRIAYLNGVATYWWLRAPYTDNTRAAWGVGSDGDHNGWGSINSYGIRPCIILPFTFKFKEVS